MEQQPPPSSESQAVSTTPTPARPPAATDTKPPLSMADAILQRRWRAEQLAEAGKGQERWLWQGYVGAGRVTLCSSQWKSGKSTLVSILLARMGAGGTLLNLAVTPARVAVISEEGPTKWDERCRELHIGSHVSFFCRPFHAKPTWQQWESLLEAMLTLRQREGLDLVVIDTLATFVPGNENAAGSILQSLLPLSRLTEQGIGVLLLHHHRKQPSVFGLAARGNGALMGHVDILIEQHWVGPPEDEQDRRRRLQAGSRWKETRRRAIMELKAEGTDYLDLGNSCEEQNTGCWEVVQTMLEESWERLTQRQIRKDWPCHLSKPDVGSLSRTLKRAVAEGLVLQQGKGTKNDPFCYWLPERTPYMEPGPQASLEAHVSWMELRHQAMAQEMKLE